VAVRPLGQLPPTREALLFARTLQVGTWLSLAVLVLAFAGYVTGAVTPRVAIEELPSVWGLRAPDFAARAGLPRGWGWLGLLRYADLQPLLGVAMLAGLSIVAYLLLLVVFLRKGDAPYALISVLQLAVLLLAASGLVSIGH
jgi:hypothetical protein